MTVIIKHTNNYSNIKKTERPQLDLEDCPNKNAFKIEIKDIPKMFISIEKGAIVKIDWEYCTTFRQAVKALVTNLNLQTGEISWLDEKGNIVTYIYQPDVMKLKISSYFNNITLY